MLDIGHRSHGYASADKPRPRRRNYHPNLERLICAAVSNNRLATMLVQAPAQALAQFEVGRHLTAAERRLVLTISDAEDIYEFAGRLHALVIRLHQIEVDNRLPESEEQVAYPQPVTAKPRPRVTPSGAVPLPVPAHFR